MDPIVACDLFFNFAPIENIAFVVFERGVGVFQYIILNEITNLPHVYPCYML